MAVIKNKRILKCLLMMVVSLFLVSYFLTGVSALSAHLSRTEYQKALNSTPSNGNISDKAKWTNTEALDDASSKIDDVMIEARNSSMVEGGSNQLFLEKTPTRRELAEQKLAESASGINNKTIDYRTNSEIGRFIGDDRGNVFIEPVGGTTVPAGRNGVDTHTLYPNGSNYNRYNPVGHGNNTTPHGHGHLMGTGPGRRGQGPSIDVLGNVVPFNSPDAHWTIH